MEVTKSRPLLLIIREVKRATTTNVNCEYPQELTVEAKAPKVRPSNATAAAAVPIVASATLAQLIVRSLAANFCLLVQRLARSERAVRVTLIAALA